MDKINDGGPAFPWGEHGTHLGGMTLRDYFAAKVMQGICAHSDTWGLPSADKIAKVSYELADAMLRARGEA